MEQKSEVAVKRHKSNTHEELYFHVREPFSRYIGGTVFFRKEADGWWHASAARCARVDQFSKSIGRTVARRRYFKTHADYHYTVARIKACIEKPDYERAKNIYQGSLGR